jgi:hypothetical protein
LEKGEVQTMFVLVLMTTKQSQTFSTQTRRKVGFLGQSKFKVYLKVYPKEEARKSW